MLASLLSRVCFGMEFKDFPLRMSKGLPYPNTMGAKMMMFPYKIYHQTTLHHFFQEFAIT
jgi:hypothetical protein